MLKLGIRYEENVVIFVNGIEIRVKVEKRSSEWVGVVFDAPKDIRIIREKLLENNESKVDQVRREALQ